MGLPGVKVGPLDPEATSEFGHVASHQSARQLIRLHRQMFPSQLLRALARPIDEPRTKGLDLDEVQDYLSGLQHANGDPVLPEGAEVRGAAVRGDRLTGQTLTAQFQLPSGRIGKWFAPYTAEALPTSFDQGAELAKVKEMTDRGVVSFDSEGTQTELLRRRNAELLRQNRALQRSIEVTGDDGAEIEAGSAEIDTRGGENLAAENEQLRRELQELRGQVAQHENLTGAGGGQVPTGGLEADVSGGESAPPQDHVASAEPPFEGYDDLKADEASKRLRSADTSDEERSAVLEYERTHANRKSVVAAAEESLGRQG